MVDSSVIPESDSANDDLFQDPRSRSISAAIRQLLDTVPKRDQVAILRDLSSLLPTSVTARAGPVLATVVELFPQRDQWSVNEMKKKVKEAGVDASAKEIYNVFGYLKRKGRVKRIGYGQYVLDGCGLVASDEFAMEPGKYDDD